MHILDGGSFNGWNSKISIQLERDWFSEFRQDCCSTRLEILELGRNSGEKIRGKELLGLMLIEAEEKKEKKHSRDRRTFFPRSTTRKLRFDAKEEG